MGALLDLDDAVADHPLAAIELRSLRADRSELLQTLITSEGNLSSLIAANALKDGADQISYSAWRDHLRAVINKHGLES